MSDYPYPPNPLSDDLQFQYQAYARRADARPSIWNTPSAREEAGRCLAYAMPWREYDASAPLDGRGTGYWSEVASWMFSALTENDSKGGA